MTGNYIYNYRQWQLKTGGVWGNISGATGASYNVTTAGEYRLNTSTVVSFSPQTYTNSIIISNASALSITDNLPITTQLTTSNAYSALINTTNAPDYTSYNWYLNGVPIVSPLNVSVRIRKPGDYMLVTTGPCGPERSNTHAVFYETADPNWNSSNFPSNTTCSTTSCAISTNTIVNGDITIQNGAIFEIVGSKVNFNGCYGIKVESGGELIIQDQSILSSSSRWKGILVEDGGKVTIRGGSHISDAVAGVIVQGEAKAYIAYNSFGRNILHIGIDEYTGMDTAYVAFDTFGHVIDSATALSCGSYSAFNNLNVARGTYMSVTGGSAAGTHPVLIHENHVWMTEERSNRWNSGFAQFTDVDSLEILTNEINGFF